jgi:hypothetical protein
MITISGQPLRTCERVSRRECLRVGGLGWMGLPGLGLPSLGQGHATARPQR